MIFFSIFDKNSSGQPAYVAENLIQFSGVGNLVCCSNNLASHFSSHFQLPAASEEKNTNLLFLWTSSFILRKSKRVFQVKLDGNHFYTKDIFVSHHQAFSRYCLLMNLILSLIFLDNTDFGFIKGSWSFKTNKNNSRENDSFVTQKSTIVDERESDYEH